ncbi:hypothetical protein C2E23DRAFT_866849 [Lenzites betulinus]|nr:hypothetical protein C2E23DRAFT_866849 [Lenzites betulinus]
MASAAWANPYDLHPWFKMPSLKRKDVSSDEEDAPGFPIRGAAYAPRRSLSPAPSPKRRRCDVLESGMSQLTLLGRAIPPPPAHAASPLQFPPPPLPPQSLHAPSPTILFPDTPTTVAQSTSPLWADEPQVTNLLPTPAALQAPVILPGSVEEPTSPAAPAPAADPDVPDVSMKVPSWYEIEKDRIVITDLEDSEAEDEDDANADADTHQFSISSALLGRLKTPAALHGQVLLAPEPGPSNALVLYRPLPFAGRVGADEDDGPRIEEVPEGDQRGPGTFAAEDAEMPVDDQDEIGYAPVVVDSAVDDEPMDIEML